MSDEEQPLITTTDKNKDTPEKEESFEKEHEERANWLLDNLMYYSNLFVKKIVYSNPWDHLKVRDSTLHERLPMLTKAEWFNEHEDFTYTFRGKEHKSIVGFLHFSRVPTEDCIFEIPTIESMKTILNILETRKSRIILSPFAGLGLYEKLLTKKGYYVIATDSFTTHNTSNKSAGQMYIEERDYKSSIKEYMEADTLLCVWTPEKIDVLEVAAKHKNIETVIFVGDPDSCGDFKKVVNKKGEYREGYLNDDFTCRYEGEGGVGITDYYSSYANKAVKKSKVYLCQRLIRL